MIKRRERVCLYSASSNARKGSTKDEYVGVEDIISNQSWLTNNKGYGNEQQYNHTFINTVSGPHCTHVGNHMWKRQERESHK